MGPFSNIKGLTYYRNNDEDPYITLKEDVSSYLLLLIRYLSVFRSLKTKKTSGKNSRFAPLIISLSPQKPKMKFPNLKSMSTMNLKKISTFTMTLCFPPSLSVSSGLTFHQSPPLPDANQTPLHPTPHNSLATSLPWVLSTPRSRSGRSTPSRRCTPTWSSAAQTKPPRMCQPR